MVFERTPEGSGLGESNVESVTSVHDDCVAGTDPGCEREINEDRYLVTHSVFGSSCFVFDGMGGAPGGAAAAQVSSDAVNEFFKNSEVGDVETAIRASIEFAQGRLLGAQVTSDRTTKKTTTGTTVVGACVSSERVAIGAVGDSRAYRVSYDGIQQLTSDHTIVQQLVDAGHLAPQDALMHPQSHVLTRCLGSEISFKVDCLQFWLWPPKVGTSNDKLLLCTDGLYSLVSDREIYEIVCSLKPEEAVAKLIQLARERGGFDNITVLIKPLGGVLRDKPRHVDYEEKSSHGRLSRSVAPPESDVDVVAASITVSSRKSSIGMIGFRHIGNLLLLSILAGVTSAVVVILLMVLRG